MNNINDKPEVIKKPVRYDEKGRCIRHGDFGMVLARMGDGSEFYNGADKQLRRIGREIVAALNRNDDWIAVADRLPGENVALDVTVQDAHDAYEPAPSDRWIERGLLFKGDHWLLRDDGHSRQNVRYELDEIVAYRRPQTPYAPTDEAAAPAKDDAVIGESE